MPDMHENLSAVPIQRATVKHTYNNNIWEVEAGESVWDNPWLHGMFKASLVVIVVVVTIIKSKGLVSHLTNLQLCAE